MILYDTFEPFRKAYLAEFRGADGLEQYKQLVYQYCVDAVALGLNHNEIVGTLFTDDNSIAMDSLVKYKLPSEVIDFLKRWIFETCMRMQESRLKEISRMENTNTHNQRIVAMGTTRSARRAHTTY